VRERKALFSLYRFRFSEKIIRAEKSPCTAWITAYRFFFFADFVALRETFLRSDGSAGASPSLSQIRIPFLVENRKVHTEIFASRSLTVAALFPQDKSSGLPISLIADFG